MMYRISIFSILIFLTSCSMNRLKPDIQIKQQMELDIVSYSIQDSDSFNVNILLKIPLKSLVFKKQKNKFSGNINYTFNITNCETNAVVNRTTDTQSITVPYYEDTRSLDRFLQIETQIILPVGEYNLLSIVQDIDSHNIFKNITELNVANFPGISKLTAFYYDDDKKYYITKFVKEDVDTLWFRFQMSNFETIGENISFNYKVLQDSSIIDSSTVSIVGTQESIYDIPLKISSEWENDLTIFIGNKGQFSSIKLFIESKNGTQLWSDKRNDIIGIMAYLLPYSEYKDFSELEDIELFETVTEYWKSKDPTSDTKKNELLEEINNRIAYANAHYSIVGSGWRSDMGKIYIIYGPPESTDRYYDTEYSYNYEIWYYTSGRKFTFSDRRNFGELKLVSDF